MDKKTLVSDILDTTSLIVVGAASVFGAYQIGKLVVDLTMFGIDEVVVKRFSKKN